MSGFLAGMVMGLHLASVHIPAAHDQNNFNPGMYARLDNGITVGAYYNTLKRASVYAGWTGEYGPFGLTIGGVTGYQKKVTGYEQWEVPCSELGQVGYDCWRSTTYYEGSSRGAITLMLAPSVKLPAVWGTTPRISVVPRLGAGSHSTVIHLSVERSL